MQGIEDYLRKVAFEPITPKTIRSATQLWREIEQVRENGFAFSLEEFTPGICGIGVAIKAQSGFPVGSLTLAIPTVRFNADSKQRGIAVLEIAAERLHRQAESFAFPKTPSEDSLS
jgi:DNA-binding IclR family transcriptional regulator